MDERLIDDLGLSNRSRNQLHNAGVHTIDELLMLSENDIANIRNLGKKSVDEILETIQKYKTSANESHAQVFNSSDEWIDSDSARNFITGWLKKNQVKISELSALSTKAYNLLLFSDLEELYKIIFAEKDELLNMVRRLDEPLADEIIRNTHSYLRNHKDELYKASMNNHAQPEETEFSRRRIHRMNEEEKLKIYSFAQQNDIKLEDLSFSVRAENCLRKAGYDTMSKILFLTNDQILAIKAMGKNSAQEVSDRIGRYLEDNQERLSAFWSGDASVLITDEDIKKRILGLYINNEFSGFSLVQIVDQLQLPEEVSEDRIRQLLGEMRASGQIEYVDYRCYKVYPSFDKYLETYSSISDRSRELINQRLNGKKYEELGKAFGITKEGVRQILVKEKKKIRAAKKRETGSSVFDEDYYSYLLNKYAISCEDAEEWFAILKRTYYYASLGESSKKKADLSKALADPQLDIGMQLRLRNYFNRNKLLIDGNWVEKKRSALENYLIPVLCKDEVSFEEFVCAYNEYLKKSGIPYDEDLYYTDGVLETRRNHVSESRIVLWKQYGKMRFYDIDKQDYSELLEELELDSFKDTELSAAKLIKYHPDLMKKYDIRDRFELHNLLKKIIEEGSYNGIHFGRMPTIRFGSFDRSAAILDLLIDNAPIGQNELVDLIHEEYGYEKNTIAGSMLGEFREYSHMGTYSIDQNVLTHDRAEVLQNSLDGDFFYIDEIRNQYMQLFSDADPQDVNPYALKQIGFNVYSRYALRNYPNLETYFRTLLRHTQDISGLRKRFAYVQAFSQTYVDMKKDLDIVEYEHNQVITIERLENAGCTKAEIRQFIEDVYDFVEEDTYFNIYQLRQQGFENQLFDLGFSDYFYDSILSTDERCSFTRIFNTFILRKKKCDVTICIFLTDIISAHEFMDSIDLLDQLSDDYGIEPPDVPTLVYKLQSSDVYYDGFMDRFYRNKEVYYGEIESGEEMFG